MDETTQDDGEIFEAVGFLNHFSDLTDGRQAGKVVYPLDEVLLLALLAVLAGAETFTDIARFGEKKLPLLRRFRPAPEAMALPPQQRVQPDDGSSDLVNPRLAKDTAVGYLMVPAVLVRLLLPLSALVSVYFFMRGHNAPGGGFVAGLVMSVALMLQFIVSGAAWTEEHLRIYPRRWIAIGLLLALATGGGAVALGFPFLTTHTAHLTLPVLGELHVPSALFFDTGVFALVLGATMLILTALAHQSIRSHRWADEQAEKAAQKDAERRAAEEGSDAVVGGTA